MSALRFSLVVNGRPQTAEAEPGTPLLWVLRESLALTGTKFGCGAGICGACTVLLDGAPVRSCQVPVDQAVGRQVTTIEGVAGGHALALRRAWITEQVTQCGYCQPGQILAAAALLAGNPDPSDADIDRALGSNLCRCGTYPRIRRAIHRAARGGA